MKFCQSHWEELKQEIRNRGLWHLVAANGEAAIERAKEELSGIATDKTYDPLAAATFMIYGHAVKCGGLYLMTGDFCPLCELATHTEPGAPKQWIDGCTDSILQYCQERGLVAPKQ